jgi:hypothetical protein
MNQQQAIRGLLQQGQNGPGTIYSTISLCPGATRKGGVQALFQAIQGLDMVVLHHQEAKLLRL